MLGFLTTLLGDAQSKTIERRVYDNYVPVFDNMVKVGGLKRCGRTKWFSQQVRRGGAGACAAMFNKGYSVYNNSIKCDNNVIRLSYGNRIIDQSVAVTVRVASLIIIELQLEYYCRLCFSQDESVSTEQTTQDITATSTFFSFRYLC